MRILLINNESDSAEERLIQQAVDDLGVGMERAVSYKQGIEVLVKHKNSIVILYCFGIAGDFKYTEAVRIMKEIVPSLLIIAISHETQLEEERELRKTGLYFHLTSPVDSKELTEVLSGAIEKEKTRRR